MGRQISSNRWEPTRVHDLLKVQQYLDDVSRLNIPASQTQWYNVDVANMLADLTSRDTRLTNPLGPHFFPRA